MADDRACRGGRGVPRGGRRCPNFFSSVCANLTRACPRQMRGSFSTAFIRDCPMFIIERLYLAVGAIILYCEARAGACSTAHRSNRPDIWDGLMLDSRTKWQRLPAGDTLLIAAILFYWIRMKVVQQLTCLTLGSPNGPAYSTGELLNTPQGVGEHVQSRVCGLQPRRRVSISTTPISSRRELTS